MLNGPYISHIVRISVIWYSVQSGVNNLFITAGRTGYSCLCLGPHKINNVVDSKRNCVS
jgi:hypothetical protein